jgi:hypothetical protein
MVHFNASDTSPMGKHPMAYAEQEDGWAPEIMWTVWRGDVSPLQESEPQFLRYPAQRPRARKVSYTVLAVQGNIHSFGSLFYDRSKASSKVSSPHSAIQSFLLQMRVSSPVLKVIQ